MATKTNHFVVTFTHKVNDRASPDYGYAVEKSVRFNSFDAARMFLRGLTNVNLIGKPIIEEVN
jgi:hypothetical protein